MDYQKELIETIELEDWIYPKIESQIKKCQGLDISSIMNIALDMTNLVTYSMAINGKLNSSSTFSDADIQHSLMSGIRLDDMEMVQFFFGKRSRSSIKR